MLSFLGREEDELDDGNDGSNEPCRDGGCKGGGCKGAWSGDRRWVGLRSRDCRCNGERLDRRPFLRLAPRAREDLILKLCDDSIECLDVNFISIV